MWYNSSKDAEKLSLTIRGFFSLGVIATIVLILGFIGIDIDETDIESLLDSVEGVIIAIGALGSALMVLYGIVRKFYFKVKK